MFKNRCNKNKICTLLSSITTHVMMTFMAIIKICYRELILFILDLDFKISVCSNEALNIFEMEPSQLIGMEIEKLWVSTHENEIFRSFRNEISNNKDFNSSCLLYTSSGFGLWLDYVAKVAIPDYLGVNTILECCKFIQDNKICVSQQLLKELVGYEAMSHELNRVLLSFNGRQWVDLHTLFSVLEKELSCQIPSYFDLDFDDVFELAAVAEKYDEENLDRSHDEEFPLFLERICMQRTRQNFEP